MSAETRQVFFDFASHKNLFLEAHPFPEPYLPRAPFGFIVLPCAPAFLYRCLPTQNRTDIFIDSAR